jgi:membrane protein required for colicin V production
VVPSLPVMVADRILDARSGALDRSLGFLFGAGRGFLICVIGWVFLAWLVQGKMPPWASEARSRPMLEKSGEALVAQLPENPEGLLKQFKKPKGETPADPVEPPEGEVPAQRRTEVPATPAPRR